MKRGEIWLADLGQQKGSVQSFIRPVLIIQNNYANEASTTINVIPLTAQEKGKWLPPHHRILNNEINKLKKPSVVLAESITTISIDQLIKPKGIIEERDLKVIERKLAYQLGLITWNEC